VGGGVAELGNGFVHVDEELKRDGSHTGGRWVLFVVHAELPVEVEAGFAKAVVAGIRGPHAGEDLGHAAKVLLHGPLAYWTTVGGKLAYADLVGEHLEERDGILDAVKGWIKMEVEAEGAPLAPVGPISGCAAGMDASGNLVLAKAVDSPCRCCNVRRSIFQDVAWGKARSNKEQSCEPVRSQWRDAASARWLSLPARKKVR
jgi:hypothetical protein